MQTTVKIYQNWNSTNGMMARVFRNGEEMFREWGQDLPRTIYTVLEVLDQYYRGIGEESVEFYLVVERENEETVDVGATFIVTSVTAEVVERVGCADVEMAVREMHPVNWIGKFGDSEVEDLVALIAPTFEE